MHCKNHKNHKNMSQDMLCCYLQWLRNTLMQWEQRTKGKVLFLNNQCFYAQMATLSCGAETVASVLEKMESCIPLALSEESLCRFLCASTKEEARAFLQSSKADFLWLLLAAKEDTTLWNALFDTCDTLRRRQIQNIFC